MNHLDERYDGRTPDILDDAYVIVDSAGGVRALLDLCMAAEVSRHRRRQQGAATPEKSAPKPSPSRNPS